MTPHRLSIEVFTVARNIFEKKRHNETLAILNELYAHETLTYIISCRLIEEDFILEPALATITTMLANYPGVTLDIQSETIHFKTINDIFNGILAIFVAIHRTRAGFANIVSQRLEMFDACVANIDGYIDVIKTTSQMKTLRIKPRRG